MQKQTERHFLLNTLEAAPEASQQAMQWYLENFEMVPNLAQLMSNAPALLGGNRRFVRRSAACR